MSVFVYQDMPLWVCVSVFMYSSAYIPVINIGQMSLNNMILQKRLWLEVLDYAFYFIHESLKR